LLPFSKLEPQAYYNLWDVLRDKRDAKHDAYCSASSFSDFKIFEI
jgi:2-succinyl-5-enolpyruvyl-6-hydroxy-3-cyclohexene-1-carboxylate synthase